LVHGFLTIGYSPVRAQVFTYAFFALTLYLLESARLTGRWAGLGLLIPLQIFWCNLHGGFLAGLGLIFMYAVGEACSRRRYFPYVAAFLLSGLATLINPYGLDYWRYLYMAISMPRPEITEWASFWQALRGGAPLGPFLSFLGILLIVTYLGLPLKWREMTPILALGLTAYLGIKHLRHQVFFLLLAGAYLPTLLTAYIQKAPDDARLMRVAHRFGGKIPAFLGLLVSLILGYLVVSAAPLSFKVPARPESMSKSNIYYPAGALNFIEKQRLTGTLLTDFDWGEYLIWHLYPRCRVALDGRFETVYPHSVCRLYFDFLYARKNWRRFLENYPPDMILIDRRAKIYALLNPEPLWQEVYNDSGCALFVRRSNPSSPGTVRSP
jgi:hypothetical protein